MGEFRLSGNAAAELDAILDWSEINFGPQARERYAALLFEAMHNVADEPQHPNVRWRRIGKTDFGVYHIEHSRERVLAEFGRVGDPRHYIVFTIDAEGRAEILSFVHDSKLLARAFKKLMR